MVTKQYDYNDNLFFTYGEYTVYPEQREVIITSSEEFVCYIPDEYCPLKRQVPITWNKVLVFKTKIVEVKTNQVESRFVNGTSTGTTRFGDSYTKRDFTPRSVYKKVSVNYTYPVYTFTSNLGEVIVRDWLDENKYRLSRELFSFPKDIVVSEEEFIVNNLPQFKEVYLTEDERISLCIEWLDTHLKSLVGKQEELKPTELKEESVKKKVILPSKGIGKPITKPKKRD